MPHPNHIFDYNGHWLHRRSDTPHFHIYWCRPGTRRVRRKSTGTSDLEEAKRILTRFADQRVQNKATDPEQVSLLECLNEYVEPIMLAADYWTGEKSALLHWSRFIERNDLLSVANLTFDMQSQYIAWRREANPSGRQLSNGTLARELGVMKAALRHAWKRGRLAHVPHVQSVPSPPPRQRFLFAEEARRLIDAATPRPHLHRFVMLALHTLQRPGAILGLKVEQVDLASGLIDFLPKGTVQSRKRKPVVPISPTLRPVLKAAIRESRSGHVVEHEGKRVATVKRSFALACKRAGLKDVTPGTLRHTGATLLLAAGVPIRQVAGMLGHTEQQTTERYGKHHPEFLKEAIQATERVFGKATGETMCSTDDCGRSVRARQTGYGVGTAMWFVPMAQREV